MQQGIICSNTVIFDFHTASQLTELDLNIWMTEIEDGDAMCIDFEYFFKIIVLKFNEKEKFETFQTKYPEGKITNQKNGQDYEINFSLNNDMQGLRNVNVMGLPMEADMNLFRKFMSFYGFPKSATRDRAGSNDPRIMRKHVKQSMTLGIFLKYVTNGYRLPITTITRG